MVFFRIGKYLEAEASNRWFRVRDTLEGVIGHADVDGSFDASLDQAIG